MRKTPRTLPRNPPCARARDVGERGSPAGSPAPVVVGYFEFTNYFPGRLDALRLSGRLDVHELRELSLFPGRAGPRADERRYGPRGLPLQREREDRGRARAAGRDLLPDKDFPELPVVLTMHGLSIQIRLLGGGIVIQDAGLVVELPDATAVVVRGPHPVLEAGGETAAVETICGQLSP